MNYSCYCCFPGSCFPPHLTFCSVCSGASFIKDQPSFLGMSPGNVAAGSENVTVKVSFKVSLFLHLSLLSLSFFLSLLFLVTFSHMSVWCVGLDCTCDSEPQLDSRRSHKADCRYSPCCSKCKIGMFSLSLSSSLPSPPLLFASLHHVMLCPLLICTLQSAVEVEYGLFIPFPVGTWLTKTVKLSKYGIKPNSELELRIKQQTGFKQSNEQVIDCNNSKQQQHNNNEMPT